jgi:hypothetical protein
MKNTSLVLLSLIFVLTACASSNMMASSALRNNEIKLSNYDYVAIYDSAAASFMELELEELFESHGLKVIGENTAAKYKAGKVLGVRYTEDSIRNGYGNPIGSSFTVSLEDYKTDKTLLTISGQQQYLDRSAAWQQVSQKLNEALTAY